MSTQSTNENPDHEFRPRQSSDSRSPCPALNALANHGYLPHNGRDFTFSQLITALVRVYNISYLLAFLLASGAFITCGKLSSQLDPSHGPLKNEDRGSWIVNIFSRLINWATSLALCRPTLDLGSLSQREGFLKIAHDGSFVHPDREPSTSPDPRRTESLLLRASTARRPDGELKGGLDFADIVRIRTENVLSVRPMLSAYHEQISLGECGLLWETLRDRTGPLEGVMPTHRLREWLADEQLPDGWWECRPTKTVGLWKARKVANEVARLSKQIGEEGIREPTIKDTL